MTDDMSEDRIREIAREEAEAVADVPLTDDDGGTWTVRRFISDFGVTRRQALQAVGLVAIGYAAPQAVLKVLAGDAQAASQDDLIVPGTVDAGDVTTATITDPDTSTTYDVGDDLTPVITASETNDGSDIAHYSTQSTGTFINITGSGFLLFGVAASGANSVDVNITVDGGTQYTATGGEYPIQTSAHSNPFAAVTAIPPVQFSSSLDVGLSGSSVQASAWVKQ